LQFQGGRKTCGHQLGNLLPDQPLYFYFEKHLVKAGLSLSVNFSIELHGEGPLFLRMNAARFGYFTMCQYAIPHNKTGQFCTLKIGQLLEMVANRPIEAADAAVPVLMTTPKPH
jgi:hypothetical protein